MSKEIVSQDYREKDGQTYEIQCYYTKGDVNIFTFKEIKRGYYFSIQPVTITRHDDCITKQFTPGKGAYGLLFEVKRKSKKAEDQAYAKLTDDFINEKIDQLNKINMEVT